MYGIIIRIPRITLGMMNFLLHVVLTHGPIKCYARPRVNISIPSDWCFERIMSCSSQGFTWISLIHGTMDNVHHLGYFPTRFAKGCCIFVPRYCQKRYQTTVIPWRAQCSLLELRVCKRFTSCRQDIKQERTTRSRVPCR